MSSVPSGSRTAQEPLHGGVRTCRTPANTNGVQRLGVVRVLLLASEVAGSLIPYIGGFRFWVKECGSPAPRPISPILSFDREGST